jgi:hypothetical protein
MTLHRTSFLAQCELANKRMPDKWHIVLTENGWWVVVKKEKP